MKRNATEDRIVLQNSKSHMECHLLSTFHFLGGRRIELTACCAMPGQGDNNVFPWSFSGCWPPPTKWTFYINVSISCPAQHSKIWTSLLLATRLNHISKASPPPSSSLKPLMGDSWLFLVLLSIQQRTRTNVYDDLNCDGMGGRGGWAKAVRMGDGTERRWPHNITSLSVSTSSKKRKKVLLCCRGPARSTIWRGQWF